MAKSNSLSLINAALLPEFVEQLPLIDWTEYAKNFPKISFTSDSFSFYASVSSVYSSKIGYDYESVDYQRSMPFLLMLPQAIQHQS